MMTNVPMLAWAATVGRAEKDLMMFTSFRGFRGSIRPTDTHLGKDCSTWIQSIASAGGSGCSSGCEGRFGQFRFDMRDGGAQAA